MPTDIVGQTANLSAAKKVFISARRFSFDADVQLVMITASEKGAERPRKWSLTSGGCYRVDVA